MTNADPLKADLYFSFRSPYSYLAVGRYRAMAAEYNVDIALRVVWPIAVRNPDLLFTGNPAAPMYILRDSMRAGEFLGIPIRWPRPDPIAQNLATREIAAEHLSSVLYLSDDSVVDLAKNLYFPKVDWQSLGSRLQTRSPGADNDVQLLLTGIKEHPDLPLFVYSAIGSAIRWYQAIDENEKANQFLGQLEEVRPTITAEHIRDEVQKGIELLKTTAKE